MKSHLLRGLWLVVVCVGLPLHVQAVTMTDIIYGLTNWASCLDFRIVGPCIDPVTRTPGLRVTYRLPHLLLDTVKIPGDSTIAELGAALQSNLLVPGGGALGNTGEWHLQYSESHVVEWPMREAMALKALPIPERFWCIAQMQYGSLTPHYFSEFDTLMWRANALPEAFPGAIGVWAPLAPRTGHCIHYSGSVASGVVGFRGTHIASLPGVHLVLALLWFPLDLADDKMQLAVPQVRECISIGQHPLSWDHGVGARDGKYLWVYWHRVSCCVSTTNLP